MSSGHFINARPRQLQRLAVAGFLCLLGLIFIEISGRAAAKTSAELWEPRHQPQAPKAGEKVRISVLTSKDTAGVTLEYQLVDPGQYCELQDAEYAQNWTRAPMKLTPAPPNGKEFYYEMPASMQIHRRLVRYRLIADYGSGQSRPMPEADAATPNFAYFVYNGVADWQGAICPEYATPEPPPANISPAKRKLVLFDTKAQERVQTYLVLAKSNTVEKITYSEQTTGKEYKYTCTLVVGGEVYDHVEFRARGERWRYQMGKNMWKFRFRQGHRLAAVDDYGRPYPKKWSHLNLRAPIQWPVEGLRGEAGMFEAINYRLFNLAGVPAPRTHWLQLRMITGEEETPADQYAGDYWGLYLAVEEVDSRFLQAHNLPDGNIYKMIRPGSALIYQGSAEDAGNITNFASVYQTNELPRRWWREHLNLTGYYSYRALCECVHHYDISVGKNYYYYWNPATRLWSVIPWDLDLTWRDTALGNGDEPFYQRVLAYPQFELTYRNRARELRDLLFNEKETGRLIDECAAIIADPQGAPSPVQADRAKWDYHPMMKRGARAKQGYFYRHTRTHDFPGVLEVMKNYITSRSQWVDTLAHDSQAPVTPELFYDGPTNFPVGSLSFHASQYAGAAPFASVQFRLAEIAPPTETNGRPTAPGRYEITAVWESGELTNQEARVKIPANAVIPGHVYRARSRVKDLELRYSHWSEPIQFTAEK